MDNDRFENFTQGIKDAISATTTQMGGYVATQAVGYAEGVDAAHDVDFDPADYDAEDLFAGYFG
ncbi:MAG TPA: hypothetical protein VF062_05480 [Candidatus Limnocylindrales bacterium]